MIKSKLPLFIGLATLMFFGLTAGSMALFSSEAISSGNTINAGTLYIGKEDGSRGVLERFIKLDNMVPGDEPAEIRLGVKNLGTMTAFISGISACITESDEKFVANALRTGCFDSSGKLMFAGSLLALDGNVVPLDGVVSLAPGDSTEVVFKVQLDQRAGNWYKGKGVEFSLTLYAGQSPEQRVGDGVITAGSSNAQQILNQAGAGEVVLLSSGLYGPLKVGPGVTVKSKDVVYETAVQGFSVSGNESGKFQDSNTVIQGFTINTSKNENAIDIKNIQSCSIIDNIISAPGAAMIIEGPEGVFVGRNDLTGVKAVLDKRGGGSGVIRYNLGDDLDPEEHAL